VRGVSRLPYPKIVSVRKGGSLSVCLDIYDIAEISSWPKVCLKNFVAFNCSCSLL